MSEVQKIATKKDAVEAIKSLKGFMCSSQLQVMGAACYGEEKQFFFDKLVEMSELIKDMPQSYEQENKGDNAIAYLHYFKGGYDGYITEKDIEDKQLQAYGMATVGEGFPDFGYISIVELLSYQVELDLHFKPTKIGTLKKQILEG